MAAKFAMVMVAIAPLEFYYKAMATIYGVRRQIKLYAQIYPLTVKIQMF